MIVSAKLYEDAKLSSGKYNMDINTKAFISGNQSVKLSDLVNNMPDISVNTLKKNLQYMKAEQIIESVGKNKGTVYLLKENKKVS